MKHEKLWHATKAHARVSVVISELTGLRTDLELAGLAKEEAAVPPIFRQVVAILDALKAKIQEPHDPEIFVMAWGKSVDPRLALVREAVNHELRPRCPEHTTREEGCPHPGCRS